jgi:hypothetical protein
MLFYAVDAVIMSENGVELQSMLDFMVQLYRLFKRTWSQVILN